MKYKFVYLVGKLVSIAIDNPKHISSDVKENYIGRVRQTFDDYLVLDYIPMTDDKKLLTKYKKIKQIIINLNYIVSVWIYDEDKISNEEEK